MLYGWGGENDLSAAVTYLSSRPGVDAGRIGVLGLSMGGEIAITGAALDPRLKAIVAEGATARTCRIKRTCPPTWKAPSTNSTAA